MAELSFKDTQKVRSKLTDGAAFWYSYGVPETRLCAWSDTRRSDRPKKRFGKPTDSRISQAPFCQSIDATDPRWDTPLEKFAKARFISVKTPHGQLAAVLGEQLRQLLHESNEGSAPPY
jgi:hypothetical protein